ncbi:MAG: MarR family transcriptional regulator [Bacteroidia bacterium]
MARTTKAKTSSETIEDLQILERQLTQLRDAFRFHQSSIRKKYGLSATGMDIIFFVREEGPQQMKTIGKQFDIKFSTLTSLVDKIEKSGLVKRVNSREDRRSILVQLTRKGKKMLDEYDQKVSDMAATIKAVANGNTSLLVKTLEKVTPEL